MSAEITKNASGSASSAAGGGRARHWGEKNRKTMRASDQRKFERKRACNLPIQKTSKEKNSK